MASPDGHLLEQAESSVVFADRNAAPSLAAGGLADREQGTVARVSRLDGLCVAAEPQIALALWERDLPDPLLKELNSLDLNAVDDLDVTLDVSASALTLAASLLASGYSEVLAGLLAADMMPLARALGTLVDVPRVRMRLEVVETDSCRKFHADYVTQRLLVSYRGPATQWVHVGDPEAIGQARTGDAAILKGRLLMDEPAILHRSPPIAGTGVQRILLTIDTPRAA